jgi:hypothetical protein
MGARISSEAGQVGEEELRGSLRIRLPKGLLYATVFDRRWAIIDENVEVTLVVGGEIQSSPKTTSGPVPHVHFW